MADLRLRSARLTDATLVAQVDDYLGQFEVQLAAMLGLTADVDVTESHFLLDNSGRITKALVRVKNVKPCANIYNTTVPKNVLMGWLTVIDGPEPFLRFGFGAPASTTDDEAHLPGGVEDDMVGFWCIPSIDSSEDGYWFLHGKRVSSAGMGLVPQAPGNPAYLLDGTGVWAIPGSPVVTCELQSPQNSSHDQSGFAYGSAFDVYWSAELDPQGIHASGAKGVVIPSAGKYLVSMSIGVVPDSPVIGGVRATLALIRDRSSTLTTWGERTEQTANSTADGVFETQAIINCNANDVLYGTIRVDAGSGSTWSFSINFFSASNFHVALVG